MQNTKITKKWEVRIVELHDSKEKKFKVTRRFPEMSIEETKVFRTKEKAKNNSTNG
jgi:hypothetical protein